MATHISSAPEVPSFGNNLAGIFSIFMDPQGAARQVFYKWCWVAPMVLVFIVAVVYGLMILPSVEHIMLNNPPQGVTADKVPMIMNFQRIFTFVTPVIIVAFMLLGTVFSLAASSMTGAKATFGNLFNLFAMSSLIKLLDSITGLIIVRLKGDDITSAAGLHPTVGLDFLVTDSTNKVLGALMNFLSLPTIWAIVMTALTFSAAFKVSKSKGFFATAPYWLLFLALAVVGGLFSR